MSWVLEAIMTILVLPVTLELPKAIIYNIMLNHRATIITLPVVRFIL